MEQRGQTIWLYLNRPQALNALNSQLLSELSKVFQEILQNSSHFRAVVITGEGKAFAAGADIAEMQAFTATQARSFSQQGATLFRTIECFPLPVVAAVNGFCLGGGCELAMACDFRYASEKAVFGQPEVSLGLIPGFSGTQRLSRLVGAGKAKEMIYTGRSIKAAEALAIGLVNKVVSPEALNQEVEDVVKEIIRRSPNAVRLAKEAINRGLSTDFRAGLDLENDLFGEAFNSPEHEEGIRAFLAKENPNF